MKIVTTENHTIEMYDSIHNLPAWRDNKVNYYLLEDSGLGTDINAVGALLNSIVVASRNNNPKDVETAVFNIMSNIWGQINEYRPDFMAWACFIKSIDGKPFDDLSRENIEKTIKMLSDDGLTLGDIIDTLDELKKKLPESWDYIFQNGMDLESVID